MAKLKVQALCQRTGRPACLGLGRDAGDDPEAVTGADVSARVHHFFECSQPILIGRGHFICVGHSLSFCCSMFEGATPKQF